MDLKTPLYDCHVSAGGKMVSFAGYSMPVQYFSVMIEHMAVREKAGLFDVSHMGEITIEGSDALENINYLLTNDFTNMTAGRVRYTLMCNEEGGIIDDLVVYKMGEEKYLLVVNAANRKKDVSWLKDHIFGNVKLEDISDSIAQIALQGPKSYEILLKVTDEQNIPGKYYSFLDNKKIGGVSCLISQTGYTGEHGFELYCDEKDAAVLWKSLLEAGQKEGLIPCGLGARDTLRLEAAMPLYGHEMNDSITPIETGLKFAVKMKKEDFIGKKAMEEKGDPDIVRVGIKATSRGIIREDHEIYSAGSKIGKTTSGTHCPYLNGAYAMALVDKEHSSVGTEVDVLVRGKKVTAEIISLPFYKKS